MIKTKLKIRKCKCCHREFQQALPLQYVCDTKCAIKYNDMKKARAIKSDIFKARQALKSRSEHLKDAQAIFNRFIRLRDQKEAQNKAMYLTLREYAEFLCISCKKPMKKINAGHYMSVGAHPELRFNEDNCHAQCEHCNTYKSGNLINYRINLIEKIGVERVEALEAKHQPLKLTISEILEIKAKYRAKIKALDAK